MMCLSIGFTTLSQTKGFTPMATSVLSTHAVRIIFCESQTYLITSEHCWSHPRIDKAPVNTAQTAMCSIRTTSDGDVSIAFITGTRSPINVTLLKPSSIDIAKVEAPWAFASHADLTEAPAPTPAEAVANVEIEGEEPTPPPVSKVKLAKDAFYINSANLKLLKVAAGMAKDEGSANVLLVGPSGYGKTSLAAAFARMNSMEYVRFNCALVRDPEEFFGVRGASNGTTTFTHTEFTKAVMAGNTVVCLDEVNRLEPWLLNALFPMLDDDRSTTIHGHTISVAPNTIFIMTMNQGYRYTGTFVIDAAFSNRAHMILKVGPMEANEEVVVITNRTKISKEVAAIIVKVANSLRKQDLDCDVSTRMTLNVARFTRYGLSMMEAFEAAIGNNASDVDRKRLIDAVKMAAG